MCSALIGMQKGLVSSECGMYCLGQVSRSELEVDIKDRPKALSKQNPHILVMEAFSVPILRASVTLSMKLNRAATRDVSL